MGGLSWSIARCGSVGAGAWCFWLLMLVWLASTGYARVRPSHSWIVLLTSQHFRVSSMLALPLFFAIPSAYARYRACQHSLRICRLWLILILSAAFAPWPPSDVYVPRRLPPTSGR